jgi:hypothetical protein
MVTMYKSQSIILILGPSVSFAFFDCNSLLCTTQYINFDLIFMLYQLMLLLLLHRELLSFHRIAIDETNRSQGVKVKRICHYLGSMVEVINIKRMKKPSIICRSFSISLTTLKCFEGSCWKHP